MTSIASSASEVKVQHRSLLIERGYEEFTGRLEQILGRFVPSKLKGLTPDAAKEALKRQLVFRMATKSSASQVKVQHRSFLIERDYEEFTGRLEQILGRFVPSKLKGLTPDAAKEALKSMEGEQGFMIIQIIDHGADLLLVGQRRKAKLYLIGNPLLAIQVNRYDIRAALYAPLRVLVFESDPGRTVVEFDQPSTLFGQFGQDEVTAGAVESDGKLDRVIAKAAMN